MKVIREVPQSDQCLGKIGEYLIEREQSALPPLGIDSILECDCGTQWVLKIVSADGLPDWVMLSETIQVTRTAEGVNGA